MLSTLLESRAFLAPLAAASVGIAGALLGLWLTGVRRRARIVVPFSAGVLLGVALFELLPELALQSGWAASLGLSLVGYGVLVAVDRYVYAVCPTCTHDHDHQACSAELHGLAGPLIAAAAIHSFLDGWSVATAQFATAAGLRVAVPLAVALHKIPEGLALGGILRASMSSRTSAFIWSVLVEAITLAGGVAGIAIAPRLGTNWMLYPLGLTAGWILYLGYHAIHSEWKLRGPAPAFVPAITGVAGAAVIQRGLEAFFR